MPTWSGSCKDLLPVYRLLCPPPWWKRARECCGVSFMSINSFHEGPHSWPKHLSKTLPPNTIVHSIRISIYEFGDAAQMFGPKQCLQDLALDHLFQPQHSPPFPLLLVLQAHYLSSRSLNMPGFLPFHFLVPKPGMYLPPNPLNNARFSHSIICFITAGFFVMVVLLTSVPLVIGL